MKHRILHKLENTRGVNRLVVILLLGIAALVVVIDIPVVRGYVERADANACALAMQKARDALTETCLLDGWTPLDVEGAHAVVDRSKWARDTLCPSGRDYDLIEDAAAGLTVVCGVHDPDIQLLTRLNAGSALEQIVEAVAQDRFFGRTDPDSVLLTLNSSPLTARRVDEEPPLKRGTFSTSGYDGTVVFYILDAEGVRYLCYADEDHCANWERGAGWSGDAYA